MEVKDILESFGLSILSEAFESHDIDLETFKKLNQYPELIKEIIPSVGKRIRFSERYNNYMKELGELDLITIASPQSISTVTNSSLSVADPDLSSISDVPSDVQGEEIDFPPEKKARLEVAGDINIDDNTLVNIDIDENGFLHLGTSSDNIFPDSLESYLRSHTEGNLLLLSRNEVLTPLKRKKLIRIVMDHLLQKFKEKIPQTVFNKVSQEICNVFKMESKDIYFRPYQKGIKKCSGMLWSRYINTRKNLGILRKVKTKTQTASARHDTNEAPEPEKLFALEYCKHNVGPTEEVTFNWGICFHERKDILKTNSNIVEYFNTFPMLKHPLNGYNFLMDDFNKCFPGKSENLYKNWPHFRSAVVSMMEEEKMKQKFEDIDLDVIFNFALLFSPTTLREKKSYRPSKLEVQTSFILYVPNAADIAIQIESRKNHSREKNFTLQPFMLVSGLDGAFSYFCIINDILYETESAVKTLDITYKVIFALDLKYQIQCKHVWQCIEKVIYDMDTDQSCSISTDIIVNRIRQKMSKLT
ncbi:unnamed protein product [Phaedon cochleariae]|uniref:Uncharacterized protein n=1 Tax=Phaedon cochleariae TaxID=80249 RepID=A0A9N9SDM4_PHACE|nr:unnamed protein product [Phaedon cochleariae]